VTEIVWLTCAEPQTMLEFLRGKVSGRKLRLFAAACCHRVQDSFAGEHDREALTVVERFADGLAGPAELRAVAGQTTSLAVTYAAAARAEAAARAAAVACSTLRAEAAGDPAHPMGMGDYLAAELGEKAAQCRLLRDLCGNPFRPVAIDRAGPAWRDGTITKLAQAIYDERAFDRMPVLADALMAAGCHEEELIAHCRGGEAVDSLGVTGPHARGCWVVDLILGNEWPPNPKFTKDHTP